jgi:hypothetical protein
VAIEGASDFAYVYEPPPGGGPVVAPPGEPAAPEPPAAAAPPTPPTSHARRAAEIDAIAGADYGEMPWAAAPDAHEGYDAAARRAPTLDGATILQEVEARQKAAYEPSWDAVSYYGSYDGYEQYAATPPPLVDVVAEHLLAAKRRDFPGVFVPMREGGEQHLALVKDVDLRVGEVTLTDAAGRSRRLGLQAFTDALAFDRPGTAPGSSARPAG